VRARPQGCAGGAPIMAATDPVRDHSAAMLRTGLLLLLYTVPPTATGARPRCSRNRSRRPRIRTGGHVAQVSNVSKDSSSSS
jgi:hypothetical protein